MNRRDTSRPHERQSLSRLGFAALVLAGLGFGPYPLPGQVSDDFNDGDDLGWTRYDPIGSATGTAQDTWTFPAGAYRLRANASPSAALGPGRVGSLRADRSSSNFQVSADLVDWNETNTQAMGLIARTQSPGLGTTKGYIFGYVSGALPYAQIVRVNNEATATISGSAALPVSLDRSRDYRLVFQGRGSELEGRIYELPNLTEPLVTVKATDSTFAEGPAGLIAFSLNRTTPEGVDVTFDRYSWFDTVPPTLELKDLGFGLIHVLWPGDAATFKLESTDVWPATTWVPVNDSFVEYFPDVDRYVYQHDASVGQKYFRLRRP